MEVFVVEKHGDQVVLDTEFGNIQGVWCSGVPAEFKRYIIELDSDDVINSNIILNNSRCEYSIKNENDFVYLFGFVEEIEDSILVLRVSRDIIMLQICDDYDFNEFVNHFVCVKLHSINFYDTQE